MSLLDLIKDKFTDAELRAKIQKELRYSTLNSVREFKNDSMIQAYLLKGAIDKMYPQKSLYNDNIDRIIYEIISNKYFQNLLEEKITQIISSLVNNMQSTESKHICKSDSYIEKEEVLKEPKEEDTFVDLNSVKYFDKYLICEEAKQKGLIKTKDDEAEFLIELMNIEDNLLQEGKLCPHCNALDMIKKGKCLVCGTKVK